jgi:molybdopterin/thiamine biosynthesis adenylyltransferase
MRVAVIGLGGLGGPAARCLAAAGTSLALFDGDQVEVHNLPRQTLFGLRDVGAPKASLAASRLRASFAGADVVALDLRIEADNLGLLDDCPIWVDATDQLASKLFFSDRAVRLGRTLVHGGAIRCGGQVLAIVPGVGPCLRCLVDTGSEGETCQSAGILGPVVALLGAEMARMALRALKGQSVAGHFIAYDAFTAELRAGVFSRRDDCEACGRVPSDPRPNPRRVIDGYR